MTRACKELRERLAVGERTALEHLERCAECAAFARDLAWLRSEVAGLPRPPFPEGPRGRRAEVGRGFRRPLVALASALSLLLAIGLALRDHGGSVPARALDAGAQPASEEPRVDLLGSLEEARRVFTSAGSGTSWLALPALREATERPAQSQFDPLASLRAAALLIEDEATKPRRER